MRKYFKNFVGCSLKLLCILLMNFLENKSTNTCKFSELHTETKYLLMLKKFKDTRFGKCE